MLTTVATFSGKVLSSWCASGDKYLNLNVWAPFVRPGCLEGSKYASCSVARLMRPMKNPSAGAGLWFVEVQPNAQNQAQEKSQDECVLAKVTPGQPGQEGSKIEPLPMNKFFARSTIHQVTQTDTHVLVLGASYERSPFLMKQFRIVAATSLTQVRLASVHGRAIPEISRVLIIPGMLVRIGDRTAMIGNVGAFPDGGLELLQVSLHPPVGGSFKSLAKELQAVIALTPIQIFLQTRVALLMNVLFWIS